MNEQASELIIGVESAQMGGSLYLTIQRNNPHALHTLTFTVEGKTVATAEKVVTGYRWDIPDFTELCSDFHQARCEIRCRTYLFGEDMGMRYGSLQLTLPDPVKLEPAVLRVSEPVTLRCGPRAKNYTTDYDLILGDYRLGIAWDQREGTYGWQVPCSLGKQFPGLRKTQGILRCITWNGIAKVGERDTAVTVEVPENERTRPRILSAALTPVSSGLPAPFDSLYIRGKTGVGARVEAESDCGDIGEIRMKIGDREVGTLPLEIPILDRAGPVRVTLTAVDSRGYEAHRTEQLEVLPYQPPRVIPPEGRSQVVCDRADGAGQLTPGGTFLAIGAGRRFSELPGPDGPRNRAILRYRWKRAEDPDFKPWETLLGEDSREAGVSRLIAGIIGDPRRSYRVELSVLDLLGEDHTMGFSIMTESISFALWDGVDGAAFGKYPEEAHVVDLAPQMTLRVRGTLEVLGETWVELGLSGAVQPSVYPHGRHEASGCFYRVIGGSRVGISLNCSVSWENHPVALSGSPLPERLRPARPVSALCPCEGGFGVLTVEPDGILRLTALTGSSYAGWIDGYVEYFL